MLILIPNKNQTAKIVCFLSGVSISLFFVVMHIKRPMKRGYVLHRSFCVPLFDRSLSIIVSCIICGNGIVCLGRVLCIAC